MLSFNLTYMWYAIVILTAALLAIFIYLLIRKLVEARTNHIIESYMNDQQMNMFTYLSEGEFSRQLIPDTTIRFISLEKLLQHYARSLGGEAVKSRITDYAEKFFKDPYTRTLKQRSWSKRMNVLYHIDDFQMTSMEDVLVQLCDHHRLSKAEQLQIYRILASFGNMNLFSYLSKSNPNIPDLTYREILVRFLTVIWRLEGIVQVIMRKRSWGEMKRKGVSSK